MKEVKCISVRESVPSQIDVEDIYYLDETTLYLDADGDEYAMIYGDPWKIHCIGNMLTKHFAEPEFCK